MSEYVSKPLPEPPAAKGPSPTLERLKKRQQQQEAATNSNQEQQPQLRPRGESSRRPVPTRTSSDTSREQTNTSTPEPQRKIRRPLPESQSSSNERRERPPRTSPNSSSNSKEPKEAEVIVERRERVDVPVRRRLPDPNVAASSAEGPRVPPPRKASSEESSGGSQRVERERVERERPLQRTPAIVPRKPRPEIPQQQQQVLMQLPPPSYAIQNMTIPESVVPALVRIGSPRNSISDDSSLAYSSGDDEKGATPKMVQQSSQIALDAVSKARKLIEAVRSQQQLDSRFSI
ncbi:hypothetical protein BDR26DRAFT_922685 [Obelidium mucronatum]|nr:hypothetical protein BDR26DRAFT_922685 [Obelidium mucronatum]